MSPESNIRCNNESIDNDRRIKSSPLAADVFFLTDSTRIRECHCLRQALMSNRRNCFELRDYDRSAVDKSTEKPVAC